MAVEVKQLVGNPSYQGLLSGNTIVIRDCVDSASETAVTSAINRKPEL